MAMSIRNPEVEFLARQLSQRSGLSMTEEILLALEERTNRRISDGNQRLARIEAIVAEFSRLPELDQRTPDEIIGYTENGAF